MQQQRTEFSCTVCNRQFKFYRTLKKHQQTHNLFCEKCNKNFRNFHQKKQHDKTNHPQGKLPKIRLPIFDGQYSNWLEFRDSFNALVESNDTLSNVQKYYYLRSSLEKEPAQVIKALEVSADNYKVAWKLLADRYENKKLIVHNHIHAIFELPSIHKESYIDLRNLYDSVIKHLRALKTLGEKTDEWDRLILYIITNKFDSITRRDWESYEYSDELPKMSDMNNFLKAKCELLEKLEISKGIKVDKTKNIVHKSEHKRYSNSFVSTNKYQCYFCNNKAHSIYNCDAFLKLPITERYSEAKKLKICINCLRSRNHTAWDCRLSKCKKCGKAHNSLLHFDIQNNSQLPEEPTQGSTNPGSETLNTINTNNEQNTSITGHTFYSTSPTQVLLSTALIRIRDAKNNIHTCRALLDSGSQSHFVSEALCTKLGLTRTRVDYAIQGVGQALTDIKERVNITIMSCHNNFSMNVNCLMLPIITPNLPAISFNKNYLNIPKNIILADPTFNESGQIDMLLGSEVFWSLLSVGQIKLGHNLPILQKTKLGWVIAGGVNINLSSNLAVICLSINSKSIDEHIVKFWEIEEINNKSNLFSESEKFCEHHFMETTRRNPEGRFIVSMPLNELIQNIGESREIALNMFHTLERKLNRNLQLKQEYTQFMTEYRDLGHMNEIEELTQPTNTISYYMPHHAVIKTTSLTTKLRVVFNASSKTDTGISLNDAQFTGPTIQQDIFSILVRFRKYNYVVTSDICKMYRQILIDPKQHYLQRIFWRSESSHELKCFQLQTVTYGTTSAPYLAVRCLHQLAIDNSNKFPLASRVIREDFFMDDMLTGANSVAEILKIQNDVSCILASAGFELRKWLSNDSDLLQKFNINQQLEVSVLQFGGNQESKTLGVLWNAQADTIQYQISDINEPGVVTKRKILSMISQIYDPMGLLGPVIVVAKLLIQELWKANMSWDEEIPQDLNMKWSQFKNDLHLLNLIRIPRQATISDYTQIELHGFADSSERAYGCCIYLRCLDSTGRYSSQLLCAKSRVAPVKQVKLPRLELCAALLLAQLTTRVKEMIHIKFDKLYFWSDSTITLAWIKGAPNKWKTFVGNRVSEIQSLTNNSDWHHICSMDNPADLISRGTPSAVLLGSKLWWHGPQWLLTDELLWHLQRDTYIKEEIPEQRVVVKTAVISENFNLFCRFSSFLKLQRTVAYVLRFTRNLRVKSADRQIGPLSPNELNTSLEMLVRLCQMQGFTRDYNELIQGRPIHKKSAILSLNPFLDERGLIRVGGRIRKSDSAYQKKHPLLLPKGHKLTELILRHEHISLFHCGPQQLLYSIRERFWPISGRNLTRGLVRKCVACFKARPTNLEYIMGNLPRVRVTQAHPFYNVGLDFGGPFLIKDRKTRGAKLLKCYICIFVCMSTKGVHIEAVSELTTDAFLSTLKRFIARRGKPANLYSDNALNFVGANNKLKEISHFLKSESDTISNNLSIEQIKWHFIPARSANFGGIWEAGIKSTKFHLKRILGNAHLTYEGFSTVLTQIEAILNSRPLSPLSSDPQDLTPLTPGHFLIGRPLSALPELNVADTPANRLSHYEQIQNLCQHFWRRWHKECISEMQTRTKWKQGQEAQTVKIGDLVVVKEDKTPVLQWQLGRVCKLHPGDDQVIRVVSVKVRGGEIKRSIKERKCRVCPELSFKTEEEYLLHVRDVHKGKFVDCYMCNVCGKTFKTRSELTQHINSKCGTERQFTCKVCGQKLMTPGSLYNHMRRHNGKASFMCRFCAKLFLTAGQLKVHERIHTQQKDFVCNVCGKGFCHRQSLITHSSVHTGVKPYQCEGCGKSFSCVGNLLKHRKTHADSCGLLPLTTHRVQNPSTKIKVRINTPDSSKLKKIMKNKELEKKFAMLESKLAIDTKPESAQKKNSETEAVAIIHDNKVEETVCTLNLDRADNYCTDRTCDNTDSFVDDAKCDIIQENVDSSEELDSKEFDIDLKEKFASEFHNPSKNTTGKKTCKRKKDRLFDLKVEAFIKERNLEDAKTATCKYCNKEYTQLRWLYKHEKDHEENVTLEKGEIKNMPFKCSCCKKCFESKEEVKQHQQLVHFDVLSFCVSRHHCILCRQVLVLDDDTPGPRLLPCHDCGDKVFANTDSLRSHRHIFHNGVPRKEYSYICEKCGKKFKQKSYLQVHNKSNCGTGPFFECKICQKEFSSNHSLKAHMRIHTSEKKLKCKFCGKRFHWKGQLKIHERSHTGEKPYTCLFCPSAFAYRDSLITHSTLHTGIKPYFCKGCGWRFSCIGNLVKHKNTHASTCGAWYQKNGVNDG